MNGGQTCRHNWNNIPITNFVVGFVGRISPEKNIPVILQCAKLMPDVSFVLVGDGPQKSPFEQMNKLDNVFFLGHHTDTEKFYAAFDMLILPSKTEGVPLVILEAMMVGTPTVASNVGAISEVITHNKNGLLVDVINSDGFVKNIQKVKNYSEVLKSLSQNCKEMALNLKAKSETITINTAYQV